MKRIFKAIAVSMALMTGAFYLSLPAISLASEVQNEDTKTDFKNRIHSTSCRLYLFKSSSYSIAKIFILWQSRESGGGHR